MFLADLNFSAWWNFWPVWKEAADPFGSAALLALAACRSQLVAAAGRLHVFYFLHELFQVVAGRVLQRRELDVGLEVPQPKLLSDGQHVPVVDIGGRRRSNRPGHAE